MIDDLKQVKTYFTDKLGDYKSVDASTSPAITAVTLERYEDPEEGDFDVLITIPEWESWYEDLSILYVPKQVVPAIWFALSDPKEDAVAEVTEAVVITLNEALGR
ncbi:hypothetical protein ASD30_25085 [Nocardioides sp. Root140]|nr:hypothetical protein ASD30_25085 [Nocardioides sp. Root140]